MAEKNKATTVWDYLQWRGDLRMEQDGFNEVDNLLLCILSYLDFRRIPGLTSFSPADAIPLPDVCAQLTEGDEQLGLSEEDYIPVMRAMAATPRFRPVRMFAFESSIDEEKVMQFAAVSFLLPDESVFIAYRGTDTTLVGWQEDFNMSFLEAVPAQLRATEYAKEVAAATPRRTLRLGGHSKGGNLAVWAAIHLPQRLQRRRLAQVYNNDGPGFGPEVLESEAYQRIADRIETFIPESSIVGMLLEHTEEYSVIASTNRSLMQHEPLSWVVLGNQFVCLGQRSEAAQLGDNAMREWLADLSSQERKEFTEALYSILSKGGKAKTIEDLNTGSLAGGVALLKEYIGADEKKKKVIGDILGRLAVDVGEELRKAAGLRLKQAEEGFRQAIAELKKPQ